MELSEQIELHGTVNNFSCNPLPPSLTKHLPKPLAECAVYAKNNPLVAREEVVQGKGKGECNKNAYRIIYLNQHQHEEPPPSADDNDATLTTFYGAIQ